MSKPKSSFDSMVKINWQKLWDKVGTVKRHKIECDDAEGYLSIVAAMDGDMHLSLDKGRMQSHLTPTFRARTFIGGGRNQRVRTALALLALAIVEDCEENKVKP